MSTTLIIGNGLAALAAIETLRANGCEDELTLFCPHEAQPYHRELFGAWLAKDVKESQVLAKMDKFAKDHRVTVITNERLTRISTKRHQLTTENKTHIPFNRLLITDLPAVAYPSIKGIQKQGVFNTELFSSVKELVKNLHEIDNVIVKVTTLQGFEFACALSRFGKDVVVVAPKEGLLSSVFDEETTMLLKQVVEGKGIRVITDDIDEILGDAVVKAVRLESGKVIAAEGVIFDNVIPELKILHETDLLIEGVFEIDEGYRTVIDNVYACGTAVLGFTPADEILAAHGKVAALNMLAKEAVLELPAVIIKEFGAKICDGFFGGIVRLPDGGREYMRFDGPSNVYKKIYLSGDRLIGAVWMNAMGDQSKVTQALQSGLELTSGAEEQFL